MFLLLDFCEYHLIRASDQYDYWLHFLSYTFAFLYSLWLLWFTYTVNCFQSLHPMHYSTEILPFLKGVLHPRALGLCGLGWAAIPVLVHICHKGLPFSAFLCQIHCFLDLFLVYALVLLMHFLWRNLKEAYFMHLKSVLFYPPIWLTIWLVIKFCFLKQFFSSGTQRHCSIVCLKWILNSTSTQKTFQTLL